LTEPLTDAVNLSATPARLFRLRGWRASFALALSLAVAGLAAMPVYDAAVHAAGNTLLGTWTVHFTPSSLNGKGVNVRRPAQIINGMIIAPGAQFNFVKAAGPFTLANGYVTGAAIVKGEIKPDGVLGGGLCSAATTMFNAAVRAGLQIDKRVNHHFYISRYPVGLDATIWTSGRKAVANLVFTNDTGNPVTIRGYGLKRKVIFEVWGVNDGRKVTWTDPVITNVRLANTNIVYSDTIPAGTQKRTVDTYDGFDAVVGRTVTDSAGFTIHQDLFKSDYAKGTGIILRGRYPGDPVAGTIYAVITPKPTTPPPPTATPSTPPTAAPTDTPSPEPTAAPTDAPPTETPGP
jgi:hypothetical protein